MQWIILSILSIFNHLTPKYYLFGSFQSFLIAEQGTFDL